MQFQARDEFLKERLSELLDRRSPPLSIKASPGALAAEIAALVRSLTRLAPSRDYAEWYVRFEDELLRKATTRAWPTQNEMDVAARSVRGSPSTGFIADQGQYESAAVDRMESWFSKFQSQMPSHGNAARTAELIRRGVVKNERDARFYGFDLGQEQMQRAMEQPATEQEIRHDSTVMASLNGIRKALADSAAEIARLKGSVKPGASNNHHTEGQPQ